MNDISDYFLHEGFRVSKLTNDDFAEVIALINHAFAYQDEAKGAERINEQGLAKKVKESEFYIWRDGDDTLAACCYIEIGKDILHFGLLCVADVYRGGGLAPAIMTSFEEYARGLNKSVLELDYMSLSPWLGAYYERYGFKKTGLVRDIEWCELVQMQKQII